MPFERFAPSGRDDVRELWRRLPEFVFTPIGRYLVRRRVLTHWAWPILRRATKMHRRTLIRRTRVVAVVGSLGKTTSTAAVARVLDTPVTPVRSNSWGHLAVNLLRTPPGRRHAVIEIGISQPGQMAGYADMVRPDVVVVTAIASEHNHSLGSLENTRDEKAQVLGGLRPGGLVVLNGDDPLVRTFGSPPGARVLTFGFGADNHVRAIDARLDWPDGTRLDVEVGGQRLAVRSQLLGRVAMYPILAAIAVAWAEGRRLDQAVRALEAMAPQPGRLQPLRLPGGVWLIRDDFKATVETFDAALDLLEQVPARRIAIFGELWEPPGSPGPHYRRLGERLATIVSRAIIVGTEEAFQDYAAGATHAGLPHLAVVRAHDAAEAIDLVRADLEPGDVVLIKSGGRQRLERVALALQGRRVGCVIQRCALKGIECESCPMLEPGWGDRPPW